MRRLYELKVCPACRSALYWLEDDGEGMETRAWCRGVERHLVLSSKALPILVQEVEPQEATS